MSTPLHDAEPDTSPPTVRMLLHLQVPELAGLPLDRLSNTGSDNALYRLGSEFVVRLPRLPDAARRLGVELDWLPRLVGLPVAVPEVVYAGEPAEGLPVPMGDRALARRRRRLGFPPPPGLVRTHALVHGNLIPGNLLLAGARLTAVIDWGDLGAGDPAQDVDPAWSVLDAAGAAAFREALDVDEPSWLRSRGFTLEHAVGGVVYYTPRRHPLGDVMQRTLRRLLSRR